MKEIVFDKAYIKAFRSRIVPYDNLRERFDRRFDMFITGERGAPLYDHGLKGGKLGLRAFSIGGDLRVIYSETETQIIFLDVGSHNQVY